MDFDVRAMRSEDWPAVRGIYSEGIATGNATFETEIPEWDDGHLQDCRLVAQAGERILGWAALSPISNRRVYSGVAEVSVYAAAETRGRGVAKRLLQSLVKQSERCGMWTLQTAFQRMLRALRYISPADSAKSDYAGNWVSQAAFGGTSFCLNAGV
jgi:L-amino acid N-acyltransferase YncA